MEGKAPWLVRGNPEYDPNLIGAITHMKVAAALVAAGKTVLAPYANVEAYDLVIEDQGQFFRIRCKTGRLLRGAVFFRTHRLRAARRETGWERSVANYVGKVDYFGVYCPENDAVYLVPISVTTERNCSLRVTPAKNNQLKGIRWASNFLVKPLQVPVAHGDDLFTMMGEEGP